MKFLPFMTSLHYNNTFRDCGLTHAHLGEGLILQRGVSLCQKVEEAEVVVSVAANRRDTLLRFQSQSVGRPIVC